MRGEGLAIAFRITFQVRKATNGLKGWIFSDSEKCFLLVCVFAREGKSGWGADATF